MRLICNWETGPFFCGGGGAYINSRTPLVGYCYLIEMQWNWCTGTQDLVSTGIVFWKQLLKIRPLFLWSTRWHIGIGAAISFWFDSWTYPIMSESKQERLTNQNISLKDVITQSIASQEIVLSEREDHIYWIWSTSACYSAKSLYDIMMAGVKLFVSLGTHGTLRYLLQLRFLSISYSGGKSWLMMSWDEEVSRVRCAA